jgi:hypothetical protein
MGGGYGYGGNIFVNVYMSMYYRCLYEMSCRCMYVYTIISCDVYVSMYVCIYRIYRPPTCPPPGARGKPHAGMGRAGSRLGSLPGNSEALL